MLDNIFGGHFVKIIFLSYSWQGNESYQSQSVVSGRTSKVTRGFGPQLVYAVANTLKLYE